MTLEHIKEKVEKDGVFKASQSFLMTFEKCSSIKRLNSLLNLMRFNGDFTYKTKRIDNYMLYTFEKTK